MFINWQLRQINLKIVYYGPSLSGKTTNLEQIHEKIDPSRRGELISLKTYADRTLYFDFLQLELGKINGLTPKIQLYTVPGQTFYEASRKLVLKGADGVVFVADSGSNRMDDNIESWSDMRKQIESLGIDANELPMIIQCNKQDLPNSLPPEMLKNMINCPEYVVVPAIAINAVGVFETLKAVITGVVTNIQKQI
ncbi:MAG: ADP-ribosylation factor-like protein [Anaerolineaceae bacterium]